MEIDTINLNPEPVPNVLCNAEKSENSEFSPVSSSSGSDQISEADIESSDHDSNNIEDVRDNFKTELARWAVIHNITFMAVDELLKLCRFHLPHLQLPNSSKTLLKTPKAYAIANISGGQYFHFGLELQLLHLLSSKRCTSNVLEVMLGIDGLPISKSSKKQFWPILGICKVLDERPFIIGLYFSLVSKPTSVDQFLQPLVQEFGKLKEMGLWHEHVRFDVKIKCVIADAPARNYIKCCVAFNGYSGCDRCVQKGDWSGRVIFTDQTASLRTDVDFINQSDKSHHVGITPLLLLDIGLVSDVILDYMHLICLGVVKKFLKKGPGRRDHFLIERVDNSLFACQID